MVIECKQTCKALCLYDNVHYMQRALKKFKGDLKLWLQHIEFSKQCGHKVSLSKTFGKALAVHSNKPGVFAVWL